MRIGMFLKEGEKENKRGGRYRTTGVRRKKKKEKEKKRRNETYGRNEMRERRNNIKNKKS